MKTLDAELLNSLTKNESAPCLSIYLPVHKNVSESAQDPLNLKNIIKDIRTNVKPEDVQGVESLLEPVEKYLEEKSFVRENDGTLAIFSSPKVFETVFLPTAHAPAFFVDDCFYVLPLLTFASENKRFHVLTVGKNHVRLFEGDRYRFEEISLGDDIPRTMKEALGYDLTDNHLHAAAGGSAAIHGYMEITDEKDTDNVRFFRIIDHEINTNYSKPEKIPLILAALPENQSLFQSLSKNECLLKDYIALNADSIDKADLHQHALAIFEQAKTQQVAKQLERFAVGKSEKLATDEVADIARHAMDSRIDQLFIAEGKTLAGTISVEDRKIKPNKDSYGDIINQIALLTYKNGGQVHTLANNTSALPRGIGSLNRF